MSSTKYKDTKSYEHVNEHTTGRNTLTENYTQQENGIGDGNNKNQPSIIHVFKYKHTKWSC
jgi:hypothetical protein